MIAYIRRGPSQKEHQARRDKFRQLRSEVDRRGLALPKPFVELVESDDYITRLRHANIRLQLPDELVPLPADPEFTLFLMFGEGEGCGYWRLLLASEGGHIVAFSEHPFGWNSIFVGGYVPDLASFAVYQCADSFSQWIVNFFAECIEEDRRHEELLEMYPGN